ncbi:DNA (cytosine-5)-methyltransferase DRM1-like [Carex rostrata]
MGYSRDDATSAIERCGEDADEIELADSILAAQTAEREGGFGEYNASNEDEKHIDKYDPFLHNNKRQRYSSSSRHNSTQMHERLKRVSCRPSTSSCHGGDADMDRETNPMVGFGLPTDPGRQMFRELPKETGGPPYFYFEIGPLAPKGVWDKFARNLGVAPEFVNSKFFSATCKKQGYLHNLPIANRFQLEPVSKKTILEVFPSARAHWPPWDTRTQFNCIQACITKTKLIEQIQAKLVASPDPPPDTVKNWVMYECNKWNLIWVGQNRVAPLEADEIEFLLGFPRNHTRGGGVSRTERYRSLENSFQVDTVAYHLSVLKDMFPNGIRVLSLFSGIGGAEVALHRLGIKMTAVMSVEVSPINRTILRGWWDQTGQKGELEVIDDIQCVDDAALKGFIARHGGFDLIVGGSSCNNLTGSNRDHRGGLHGERLFFHYQRILDRVRYLIGRH